MLSDMKPEKPSKKTYKSLISSGLCKKIDKDLCLMIKAEINELSNTINYLKINDNMSDAPLIEKLRQERASHSTTYDLVEMALKAMEDIDKNTNFHRAFFYVKASKKKLTKLHYKIMRFTDIDDVDLLREFAVLNTEGFYKFGGWANAGNLFVITVDNVDNLPSSYKTVPYELAITTNKKEFILLDIANMPRDRRIINSDTIIKQIYQQAREKYKKMDTLDKIHLDELSFDEIYDHKNTSSKIESIIAKTKLSDDDM